MLNNSIRNMSFQETTSLVPINARALYAILPRFVTQHHCSFCPPISTERLADARSSYFSYAAAVSNFIGIKLVKLIQTRLRITWICNVRRVVHLHFRFSDVSGRRWLCVHRAICQLGFSIFLKLYKQNLIGFSTIFRIAFWSGNVFRRVLRRYWMLLKWNTRHGTFDYYHA